jgi:large subunit ribosomal protein L1
MATAQKLPKLSKRMKVVRGKVDRSKAYPVDEALKLVKETAVAKFDESVDVAVNLGVDAKKSDQTVRGSVVLPRVRARVCASPCLRRAKKPRKRRPPAQTSSASRTWQPRSRKDSWSSTW